MKMAFTKTNYEIVERHLMDALNILNEIPPPIPENQNAKDRTEEAILWIRKSITILFPGDSVAND